MTGLAVEKAPKPKGFWRRGDARKPLDFLADEGTSATEESEATDEATWDVDVAAEEAFAALVLGSELAAREIHGRLFWSHSKGRRRRRKRVTPVLLFGYGGRWYMIKEEGDAASELIPWDEIAGECRLRQSGLDGNGAWPGDSLRSAVIRALWGCKRF